MASPRDAAAAIAQGFAAHDAREYDEAVAQFARTDRFQFRHLSDETARKAATAYVDALWAKDAVEDEYRTDDGFATEQLRHADWSLVWDALAERADLVGMDTAYATETTQSWVEHKCGGDYWTPMMNGQRIEFRAATQRDDYPRNEKRGDADHGFGTNPVRYLLGVELHDARRYDDAVEMMTSYYEAISEAH